MADWYKSKDSTQANQTPQDPLLFNSRRSPVLCRNGCVSSSQPLASSIGLQILREKGGNAADAAIAMAAALAVLEPCSTGLGGDMFALLYSSEEKKVFAVNGSGRAPAASSIEKVKADLAKNDGTKETFQELMPKLKLSVHSITVPGAARGWEDLHIKHGSGKLSFSDLLEPAAQLASEGFPVAPITAQSWQQSFDTITQWVPDGTEEKDIPLSINGKAPRSGEIYCNPDMANVLRSLGKYGATKGFYEGFPGQAIVNEIKKHGGFMEMEDLKMHHSTFPDPIKATYRGVDLWQIPPNGQGIAGLIALKGIAKLEEAESCEQFNEKTVSKSAGSFHTMIEMMRLGFGDARRYVHDTDYDNNDSSDVNEDEIRSVDWLLSDDRIGERAKRLFNKDKAVAQGESDLASGTVSFQVVDKEGNAISFVNSNFMGFGTGLVPDGCGFSLQNRGFGFSLDPKSPNALAPRKRPYHTIIPGMLTHSGSNDLYATFSNMGGYMQPQGHMQLTIAMVAGGLDPQRTVDLPRFCIADGTYNGKVFLEEGIDEKEIVKLKKKGHDLISGVSGSARSLFGRAQIIKLDQTTGVLWAGSDGRADGCAIGY